MIKTSSLKNGSFADLIDVAHLTPAYAEVNLINDSDNATLPCSGDLLNSSSTLLPSNVIAVPVIPIGIAFVLINNDFPSLVPVPIFPAKVPSPPIIFPAIAPPANGIKIFENIGLDATCLPKLNQSPFSTNSVAWYSHMAAFILGSIGSVPIGAIHC